MISLRVWPEGNCIAEHVQCPRYMANESCVGKTSVSIQQKTERREGEGWLKSGQCNHGLAKTDVFLDFSMMKCSEWQRCLRVSSVTIPVDQVFMSLLLWITRSSRIHRHERERAASVPQCFLHCGGLFNSPSSRYCVSTICCEENRQIFTYTENHVQFKLPFLFWIDMNPTPEHKR